MRKYRKKQIQFVISLLDRPTWYNETITHPNWPTIKRAIAKLEPIPMVSVPKIIEDNFDKMQELRNWQYAAHIFAIVPQRIIVGVTS